MGRTYTRSGRASGDKQHDSSLGSNPPTHIRLGSWWDQLLIRLVFSGACIAAGFHFHPFGLTPLAAGIAGLLFSLAVLIVETRLQGASLRLLIGAVMGLGLGVMGAYLVELVFAHTSIPEDARSFLGVVLLLMLAYLGLVIGANKGDMLNLQALGGLFGSERNSNRQSKIFDTSVIIDGRIADICEAHFVDGVLLVPQFVLRELQLVADSADNLKRQRGRRGLEVLQRIQEIPHLEVAIVDEDFPQIADVDMKLIELAKRRGAQILTNDYNLNKIATLQGIEVLNVNQLANALKPVVLPGEAMRVFVLREGKEHNQGVAYLDDGTMVVVDNGRKAVNKTIDITVTSVHQTTAGKMIFGRYDERGEPSRPSPIAAPPLPGTLHPGERMSRSIAHEPSQS